MIIFEGPIGSVIALEDPGIQGNARLVAVPDDQIDMLTHRSIVTRLTVSQEANVQFLHTLGAHIFIYVFGDRIGTTSLSGLSFANSCDLDVPGLAANLLGGQLHGGELVYDWYKRNRVSRRKAPIRVMVGLTPIDGFVTAFTADVIDPMSQLIQWGLTLRNLPDE